MGSTRSGEPSGPRLAALVLLLVAVLVGSFAPACAQAQNLTLTVTVTNKLVNDVNCTITASELPGSENLTFFVRSGASEIIPINATESLAPAYVVQVLGDQVPLGGKTFSTGSTAIARGASLTGFEVVLVGPCMYDKSGLKIETYIIVLNRLLGQLIKKTKVSSECVQPQKD